MQNIGIMGGTFNPIHNVHLIIAELAAEEFLLDKVLFITSGNPPHKTHVIQGKHRLEMTNIALIGNNKFEVCDYEVKKKEYSYTVETLEYLKSVYKEANLYFIIGLDSLRDIPKWHMPEKIFSLCSILVFKRGGYSEDIMLLIDEAKKKYNGDIHLIDSPSFEISSTYLRERIKDNKSVNYFLPEAVDEYIKKENLYKDE